MRGQDRIGSEGKYCPYGEERGTATGNDRYKFATYYRDSETGLDYAVNRYYISGWGRFLTADPYMGSMDPMNPQSFNDMSYVAGDPVNAIDPEGLQRGEPGAPASYCWVNGQPMSQGLCAPRGGARHVSPLPREKCSDRYSVSEDETERLAMAILLGESSYPYIGQRMYDFGDSYGSPAGPIITAADVRTEQKLMMQVMSTNANTYKRSLYAEMNSTSRYEGLARGKSLLDRFMNSTVDSDCKRLLFVWESVEEFFRQKNPVSEIPVNQWRAVAAYGQVRPPEKEWTVVIRIGRTDFFWTDPFK